MAFSDAASTTARTDSVAASVKAARTAVTVASSGDLQSAPPTRSELPNAMVCCVSFGLAGVFPFGVLHIVDGVDGACGAL